MKKFRNVACGVFLFWSVCNFCGFLRQQFTDSDPIADPPPATRTPKPTFTATLPPTLFPDWMFTPVATGTSVSVLAAPVDTATSASAPSPTATLVPAKPRPTEVPMSAPPPTGTPIPSPAYQYTLERVEGFSQCGPTQIYGENLPAGVCIKVWADGWPGAVSNPSGVRRPKGECEVSLGYPKQAKYYVAVLAECRLDAPLFSDTIVVELEGPEICRAGGKQGVKLFFKKNW